MLLHYLGTAAAEGWPALYCRCNVCREARIRGGKNIRSRAQAVIDDTLLIDFGPDTYMHTIYGGLDLASIRSCIITHPHEDHFSTDDIVYRIHGFAADVLPGPFTFYGSRSMTEAMEQLGAWTKDPERIAWKTLVPFTAYTIEGYTVTAFPADHGFGQTPPIACYIYSIEKDGRRMLYAHDTGFFPEETWQALQGMHFDLVSLDCTMQKTPSMQNHMGFDAVRRVKERLLAMGCANRDTKFIVNHFSHNGGVLHEEMEAQLAADGILVAYDGFQIEV